MYVHVYIGVQAELYNQELSDYPDMMVVDYGRKHATIVDKSLGTITCFYAKMQHVTMRTQPPPPTPGSMLGDKDLRSLLKSCGVAVDGATQPHLKIE